MKHWSAPLPVRSGVWFRLAAIALAIGALITAYLPAIRGPVHLLVLLDESASMPRAWMDEAWSDLIPRLAELPPDSRLSVVRIGSRPVVEIRGRALDRVGPLSGDHTERLPRHLPLNDTGTAIAAALTQARELLGRGESGLVLLISDGRETLGHAAPVLRRFVPAGIPVLWWDPSRGRTLTDAGVTSLEVKSGTDGVIVATVGISAGTLQDAQVLVMRDGRPALQRQVALEQDQIRLVELGLGHDRLAPGFHQVTAQVRATGDLLAGNDRRGLILNVAGPPRLGLVARRPAESPVTRSLTAGGWAVEVTDAAGFDPKRLDSLGVLILEGISPAELSPAAWTSIERAVTRGGTGLILLGGPGTFGAGGYRHSTLEALLPVTAQAPDRTPAAAVIYAVDTSGSMAQPTRLGTTRLELARAAVAASVGELGSKDQSAVLVFDVQARVVLPLAVRGAGTRDVAEAWHPSPGGGTRLAPVIDRTLGLLAAPVPDQRLLVLVSDGQVTDPERAVDLGGRIKTAGVKLSVLAVGDAAAGANLRALAQAAGGRYQEVADLLELPRLMEAEVERRRDPIESGPIRPQALEPLPFAAAPVAPWPELAAYPVTRAREGARVYLAAPNGDPLLAAHRAGAGWVLALPAGLGDWAPDWPTWSHWGTVLGGLVDWAAGGGEPMAARLDLQPDGSRRLQIDRVEPAGTWSPATPLALRVQDPEGREIQVQAEPAAPGRYTARLPDGPVGHYRILATEAGAGAADLWYQPDLEFTPGHGLGEGPGGAVAAGLLVPWSAQDGGLPLPRLTGRLPRALVLAALLVFLAGLFCERFPFSRIAATDRPTAPTCIGRGPGCRRERRFRRGWGSAIPLR